MGPPDKVREATSGGPERFWDDLASAVQASCASHEEIDDALRAWLDLVASGRDEFLQDEDDLARCSRCLLDSPLCSGSDVREYVRTQIVYSLLQEDESRPLHAIANYLLLAGRVDDVVFAQMIEAGCFARLVELIKASYNDDRRLHRLLLELMYEMARVERVRVADLLAVDDGFVGYLFQVIEDMSDDSDDPYHFPVIRVLLILNEQYMVAATTAAVDPMSPAAPLTNRVVKVLSLNGPLYRTFGENIILLLNRATETSLQLLILKLLYLLFTTHATYEYFYTNDLRVLLDVIIRNLLDLPNESASLRHTYLRVLYPLLAHTQLNQPPQYKRDEILRVLAILSGSGNVHFAPADETTLRLVDRVAKVEWLSAPSPPTSTPTSPTSPAGTLGTVTTFDTTTTARTSTSSSAGSVATVGSLITDDSNNTEENAGEADRDQVVNKFLGISLSLDGRLSRASVEDVAAVKEKPGIKTPSRKAEFTEAELRNSANDDYDAWSSEDNKAGPATAGDDSHPIPAVTVEFVPKEEDLFNQGHPPPCPTPSSPKAKAKQSAPPAVPPERRRGAKRAVPAVPKHRHAAAGKALAGSGSAPTSDENGTASGETNPTAAAAAAAAHTAHEHSHHTHHTSAHPAGAGIKKLPPKLPPPRRAGRLRPAASNANLQQQQASAEVGLGKPSNN
ncbi:hypothetical protein SPBR_06726 [Sporothrix brasiliensis 5110]|uniref:SPIN90/Ldb17 leucine-rich domain-containing protein n=1 Tax=Sporothrix brasiliensis 5110 TaxID=1398154 RepID=A0A0C2IQ49_9PEZI|nr:uncharacterized protein SPBR_06726 [Sporothrix brasiliensis 5110]KIH89055.1 hypothetical protein SPBR_06726 [Sporothrix brasiliensis 5110]